MKIKSIPCNEILINFNTGYVLFNNPNFTATVFPWPKSSLKAFPIRGNNTFRFTYATYLANPQPQ